MTRRLFEDLPDELLLKVCQYLRPIDIFYGFYNLNQRLNRTITFYRENVFLSDFTQKEFEYFLDGYLFHLASNVRCLIIDNRSTDQLGKRFEKIFNKLDQQFPRLERLIFYRIDVETLENFSWRFNTMLNLRHLTIDIGHERLRTMPPYFDAFLCGKLFSSSNVFQNLTLNLDRYAFSLISLKNSYENLRFLTISIKTLKDLCVIFDSFPNLEQLIVTIGCSTPYESSTDVYPYDRLWWKTPQLKSLKIQIEQKSLYRYEYLFPSEILFKIIRNLHSLIEVKFLLNIEHEFILRSRTTKETFFETFSPFIDGSRWQNALERLDNRTIRLEFHIELDGIGNLTSRFATDSDRIATIDENATDFRPLINATFSNAFWLLRNINIEYSFTPGGHYSIYTKPINSRHLSTTIRMIERDFAARPSVSYSLVQHLNISSSRDPFPPVLSLKTLFEKFPYLNHLTTDTMFELPANNSIISTRFKSLTISQSSTASFRRFFDYFPQLRILSIESSTNLQHWLNVDRRPIVSIECLKFVVSHDLSIDDLAKFIEIFPNLNEFYLTIRYNISHSARDIQPYLIFEQILAKIQQIRYIETTFDIKHDVVVTYMWKNHSKCFTNQLTAFSDGNIFRLKLWF